METDSEIPKIFNQYKNENDHELKKQFLTFFKIYKDDINDYGGKVAKTIKIFNENSRPLKSLLKSLSSNQQRTIFWKITSKWVVENLTLNCLDTIEIIGKSKKKKSSHIFRFLGNQNLGKIRDENLLSRLIKFCLKNLGKYFYDDKYILQILTKILDKNFKISDAEKVKIVSRSASIFFTYFALIGHPQKSRNIEFLRNYLAIVKIVQNLKIQFFQLPTIKKKIKNMIGVEVPDELYEVFLKILVVNLGLKLTEKGSIFDDRKKIFKDILKEKSFNLRFANYPKNSDFNPKKKLFSSGQSSGFSTSDSTSFFKKEAGGLEGLISKIKISSAELIIEIIRKKKKIFQRKKNWRMIIPIGNIAKAAKFFQGNYLFPFNLVPIGLSERAEKDSKNFSFTKNFLDYQKSWFNDQEAQPSIADDQQNSKNLEIHKSIYMKMKKFKTQQNSLWIYGLKEELIQNLK